MYSYFSLHTQFLFVIVMRNKLNKCIPNKLVNNLHQTITELRWS